MALKISAKTEYACIAVMELAVHRDSPKPIQIRAICERHSVPPRFLVQILLQLKTAGIVESTRGAAGGYRLKMSPDEVTLAQIMDIIDAPVVTGKRVVSQTGGDSDAAMVLKQVWDDAERCRHNFLNNITFAELIHQANDSSVESKRSAPASA